MSDPIARLNHALEGRYRIERELGEGGMATVYLARDLKHERPVAIKVLKPALAANLGSERFLAEIRTTAGLQHPHILPLHDSGEADGFHLIWVEQDGTLLAAPLDPRRLELASEGVVLGQLSVTYAPDLALSGSGRFVYTASPSLVQRVVWVERDGSESTIDAADPMEGSWFVALSPDGTRLAVSTFPRPPSDDGDVFVKDLPAGAYQRVTSEGAVNFRPEWSPDGQSLTFISDRLGDRERVARPSRTVRRRCCSPPRTTGPTSITDPTMSPPTASAW